MDTDSFTAARAGPLRLLSSNKAAQAVGLQVHLTGSNHGLIWLTMPPPFVAEGEPSVKEFMYQVSPGHGPEAPSLAARKASRILLTAVADSGPRSAISRFFRAFLHGHEYTQGNLR